MRALDPVDIDKNATGGPATGNPNEFTLLDLTPILGHGGQLRQPDDRELGLRAVPVQHDRAGRVPRPGRVERRFHRRQAVPVRHDKAALIRLEAYNLFNHHNMYVRSDAADISSFTTITGFQDDNRRMQLGFKFEF